MYTYKMTTHCLLSQACGEHPYRPAYLPNFDKRSLTISRCMSIGAHCVPHCKILVGKEGPATLNQPSPHIFFEPADTTFVWFLAYWRIRAGCCPGCARDVLPLLQKTGCCPGYAREVLPLLADHMCVYTSSSGVLPRLRRRGVAPRSKNSKESTKFHRVGGSAQHINIR